jgi:hypothetical protein
MGTASGARVSGSVRGHQSRQQEQGYSKTSKAIQQVVSEYFVKLGRKRGSPASSSSTINGKEMQCLVNTRASISVVSSDTFKRMWQHWEVCQLPMPRILRVAGITGHHISVENYVMMDIEVLGVKMRRPMLVVSGLDHTEVVLG